MNSLGEVNTKCTESDTNYLDLSQILAAIENVHTCLSVIEKRQNISWSSEEYLRLGRAKKPTRMLGLF